MTSLYQLGDGRYNRYPSVRESVKPSDTGHHVEVLGTWDFVAGTVDMEESPRLESILCVKPADSKDARSSTPLHGTREFFPPGPFFLFGSILHIFFFCVSFFDPYPLCQQKPQ